MLLLGIKTNPKSEFICFRKLHHQFYLPRRQQTVFSRIRIRRCLLGVAAAINFDRQPGVVQINKPFPDLGHQPILRILQTLAPHQSVPFLLLIYFAGPCLVFGTFSFKFEGTNFVYFLARVLLINDVARFLVQTNHASLPWTI